MAYSQQDVSAFSSSPDSSELPLPWRSSPLEELKEPKSIPSSPATLVGVNGHSMTTGLNLTFGLLRTRRPAAAPAIAASPSLSSGRPPTISAMLTGRLRRGWLWQTAASAKNPLRFNLPPAAVAAAAAPPSPPARFRARRRRPVRALLGFSGIGAKALSGSAMVLHGHGWPVMASIP